jgi:hypothetical protein
MKAMNKEEIDAYFISKLEMFEKIAAGILYKQNKRINKDVVINEAYLHLSQVKAIESPIQLEKIVVNFIKMNIGWTNSRINKQEKISNHNDLINTNYMTYGDDGDKVIKIENSFSQQIVDEDSDIELLAKIEIEKWYDSKQAILFLYRQQEEDKIKQIIYDCYFNKGITKGLDLAKHLGVNKDYASKYVREMKQSIRDFNEEYIKNNN